MIEITTLGNFSVKRDEKIISDKSARTQKLWKLLNILIVNRNKPSPISYIVDLIWGGEECENTAKALHNLIFRLRRLLSPDGEDYSDYIIFTQNCYMLSPSAGLWVDAYEMEDTYLEAGKSGTAPEEKIALYNKVISLYNGRFLLNAYEQTWAKMAAERYERIYTESVAALSDLYFKMKQYDAIINICSRAIETEILDEKIYVRLIKSMRDNGQIARAISVCEGLFERLRREIGVDASREIKRLYDELKNEAVIPQETSDSPGTQIIVLEKPLNNEDIAYICEVVRERLQESYSGKIVNIKVEVKIVSDNRL